MTLRVPPHALGEKSLMVLFRGSAGATLDPGLRWDDDEWERGRTVCFFESRSSGLKRHSLT
jgi:hypothetical protein